MCGSSLRDIMAKIQVVLDELQPRSTAIIPCDYTVHTVHDVELGGFVPDTLEGGGGTLFQPALDYAQSHYPNSDGIVYLTDGYASDLHKIEEPTMPVLWLTYGLREDRYPFGDAIKVRLYN
jgi:predicted metal-dependent peptidase